MDRDSVAAIGFDIDHTLVIDNKLERVAFMRLLESIEADGGRGLSNLEAETAQIDDLLQRQRKGAFSIDEAVAEFAVAHGVAPRDEYVDRFRTMAVEMVADFVIPLPAVRKLLRALDERGVRLAVLSNGWNPLQTAKAQRAGFDGPVLASADIGVQKPSARAFEALLGVLGTRPEQTWFVGDDPYSDVDGSRAAGLHSVWFDWEGKTFPKELAPPPSTIHSLLSLLDVIRVSEEVR